MAVMVEEMKSCPKKDFRRSSKNNKNNHQQKIAKTTLFDAISRGGNNITSYKAEDGSVRMKILVKKQDLKQILGAMNNAGIRDRPRVSSAPQTASSTIERRLFELMRKKKANAQAKGINLSSWRPHLQSIPEEH